MESFPPQDPGTGRACGAVVVGADGHLVDAVATITAGPAGLFILGLPETGTREARDRIRAAILNSALPWPSRAITVDLLPASLPKRGTSLDLAIAIAVLTAAGAVPADAAGGCVLAAGLGLDGRLRPVPGVLPMVLAAAATGYTRAIVAPGNAAEAATVPGLTVTGCQSLRAAVAWLRSEPLPGQDPAPAGAAVPLPARQATLAHLAVPPHLRLALEVSAAGYHHLGLTGPPATAIPVLAESLATLLPPLSAGEALEVSAIHSAAGLTGAGQGLITRPPCQAPHHTVTRAAMLGGGSGVIRPGAAALAHRGVLFLGDAAEFGRDVLAAVDCVLADGAVTVARGNATARFPARFTMVAGTTPCPCGPRPDCACTPLQIRRYRARVTRTVGSQISLWLSLAAPGRTHNAQPDNDADAISAGRVASARDRARRRLSGTPWQVNADVPAAELGRSFAPPVEAMSAVTRAVGLGEISTRSANQIIRMAWTLADLAGHDRPGAAECGQALAFHLDAALWPTRVPHPCADSENTSARPRQPGPRLAHGLAVVLERGPLPADT